MTNGIAQFPEPSQGGVFDDEFVELAHSGLHLNKQPIENKCVRCHGEYSRRFAFK